MIPDFPEFKKIELSDKEEIEAFTIHFPPYSDFNFSSMWSWNINNDTKISKLNNNLVVRFSDYISGRPFFSFVGLSNISDTVEKLINYSQKEGLAPTLRLISQDIVNNMDKGKFTAIEDRDQFDYILSVDRLLPHDGVERRLSSRRKAAMKFKTNNNVEVRALDLSSSQIQASIMDVFKVWELQLETSSENVDHLRIALLNFFNLGSFEKIIAIGIYLNNSLIGYSINENLGNGYALGHFQQGDLLSFNGIYSILMHDIAPVLSQANCEYINIEQDLNIQGLRSWKMSLNPLTFLKKYIITKS